MKFPGLWMEVCWATRWVEYLRSVWEALPSVPSIDRVWWCMPVIRTLGEKIGRSEVQVILSHLAVLKPAWGT